MPLAIIAVSTLFTRLYFIFNQKDFRFLTDGTIEIQPEPNYGHYPIVSKEYAKLRKEVQQRRPSPNKLEKRTDSDNSDMTYYVIAESSHTSTTKVHRSPGSFGTTRHIIDPSTKGPFYYNSMPSTKGSSITNPDSVIDIRTRPSTNYRKNITSPGIFYGTTNYQFQNTNYKRPFLTTNLPRSTEATTKNIVNSITLHEQTTPKQLRSSDYEEEINDDVILSLVDSLFDNEINKIQNLTTNENSTGSANNYNYNTSIESTTNKIENNKTTTVSISTSERVNTTESQKNLTKTEVFNLTDVLSTLLSTLTEDEDTPTTTDADDVNSTTVTTTDIEEQNITTTEIQNTEITTESNGLLEDIKTPMYSTALTTLVTTTDCIKIHDSNTTVANETKTESLQGKNSVDNLGLTVTEINEINNELEEKTSEVITTSTTTDNDETTTVLTTTEKDITEVDLESKVKVDTITIHPFKKIPSEIEAILNITINKNKDYEEYDYNEPTLPPSLPNLR